MTSLIGVHFYCTSAHVVTFLWRASGKPAASGGSALANDYPNAYYTDALAWADSAGLLDGVGYAFVPNQDSPRANIVTYLYRNSMLTGEPVPNPEPEYDMQPIPQSTGNMISVSNSNITVQEPTTITVSVNYDENKYPDGVSLTADYDSSVVEIEWGDWDGWTIPLKIIPVQNGTATVKISAVENPNEYHDVTITVTKGDTSGSDFTVEIEEDEYEKYMVAACAMNYFFESSKFPNTVCFKNAYFTTDNGAGNRLWLIEGYGENCFGGNSYAYVAAMVFSEPTTYPSGNYMNYELGNGMYVRAVAHNDN